MFKTIIMQLLQSEVFRTLLLVAIGFLISLSLGKIKAYVSKTPNQIDDAIFNFLVNDVFLKVEKNKIDSFVKIFGDRFGDLSKLEKALQIFKVVYKEQTGKSANESLLTQAKAVWSELAIMYPSNSQPKQNL